MTYVTSLAGLSGSYVPISTILILFAVSVTCGGCASYELTADDCDLSIVLGAKKFKSPDKLDVMLKSETQTAILIEQPASIGIGIVREETYVSSGTTVDRVKGSGFRKWDLSWGVPPASWQTAAKEDERGLLRVDPGRYRVVVRFHPGADRATKQVCVVVSDGFSVEEWSNLFGGDEIN